MNKQMFFPEECDGNAKGMCDKCIHEGKCGEQLLAKIIAESDDEIPS